MTYSTAKIAIFVNNADNLRPSDRVTADNASEAVRNLRGITTHVTESSRSMREASEKVDAKWM